MQTPPAAAFASPVSDRDRTLLLAGILLALFLAALDQTIVSTALPRIVEDLEGVSRYAWVATAYLLASTALVPVYGKLADTYPRKHVELGAVILFLVGSFLCGLSGELGTLPLLGDGMRQLVLFRGIQGAGAAGLMAMTFIVIADLYTPAERGRYQGLVGGVWAVSSLLGPLVGGLLTDHAGGVIPGVEGWRWVFYVNMPLGLLALWFIARRMPRLDPPGERLPPDLLGAAYLLAGLVPLILGLQMDPRRSPGLAATLFAGAVVMLAAFWLRARRARSPILDLHLFDNLVFRRANASGFFFGAAFMSVVIFLPLFLVNVLGVSATGAGAALIPYSLGLVVSSTLAGQLVSRIGHLRDIVVAGGFLLLGAVAVLASMDADVAYWQVTLTMVFAGLGMGPSMPLFTLAIQNAVDVRRLGQATSAAQFFRQMGATMGAAVMGAVLASTLGLSFARLELPSALTADEAGTVERLAATGGGTLPDLIRDAHASLAADVSSAVAAADAGAMAALAQNRDLPPAVSRELSRLAASAGPASASPGASAVGARLSDQVTAGGEASAVAAREGVRQAFAAATHRIYTLAVVLVAAALLLALRVPELPLRKTHDRVVVAE
ncbi:MAG: MDR family MFS transporter [Longimicrobiales bacterium]|nr:MDR family MFS transporter [Longimicrobiales bacterium]